MSNRSETVKQADMARIARVGAVAFLLDISDEEIEVGVEYFADLDDGRRVVTDERHGGGARRRMLRRGLGAIYRRYHGEPVPSLQELEATYRVGTHDVEDLVMEVTGLVRLDGRRRTWESLSRFVFWELTRRGSEERRKRWAALRLALDQQRLPVTGRELDALPFQIEIADDLRLALAVRPEPGARRS